VLRRLTTWTLLLLLAASTALAGCAPKRDAAPAASQPASATAAAEASRAAALDASASVAATGDASIAASGPAAIESTSGVSASASRTAQPTRAVAGSAPAEDLPLPAPIATLPAPKPAKTITGPRDMGVPVLMYHVIGIAPAGAANPDLYVTPDEFVAQLRYLSTHGYHAVTLQQVYDFWHNGGTLPSKPVVLSFDDGDTPDYTIAAPLMKQLDWPGCLNLVVGKKKLRLKPGIIRALIAAGWEIDSHTITHTDVPGLGAERLKKEIAGSRKRLQDLYGVPVNFFCYPSGAFDANAVAAVEAAGYLGATTTRGGLARPGTPFLMRRVRVSGGRSVSSFASLLDDAR
jgi:peptidoglycan/xylan/chitin deacetylase (PgdA/CDA1 family)